MSTDHVISDGYKSLHCTGTKSVFITFIRELRPTIYFFIGLYMYFLLYLIYMNELDLNPSIMCFVLNVCNAY